MPETSKSANPTKAPLLTRSRLRLVPPEDRLLLDGADRQEKEIGLWLTRDLALKLFQRLRARMEQGSATAGKVALGWEQEALALEHAAILKSDAGKGPGKPWRGEGKPQLVNRIGTKPLEDRFQLIFFSGKTPLAGMVLAKTPLHRFAAMLVLRIQQAGWDTGLDLSWLGKPPKPTQPARKAN